MLFNRLTFACARIPDTSRTVVSVLSVSNPSQRITPTVSARDSGVTHRWILVTPCPVATVWFRNSIGPVHSDIHTHVATRKRGATSSGPQRDSKYPAGRHTAWAHLAGCNAHTVVLQTLWHRQRGPKKEAFDIVKPSLVKARRTGPWLHVLTREVCCNFTVPWPGPSCLRQRGRVENTRVNPVGILLSRGCNFRSHRTTRSNTCYHAIGFGPRDCQTACLHSPADVPRIIEHDGVHPFIQS